MANLLAPLTIWHPQPLLVDLGQGVSAGHEEGLTPQINVINMLNN
jgi:hypothetical protein